MRDHVAHPTTSAKGTSNQSGLDQLARLHIMRELADTTWRMAVPVLIMAGIGIFLDLQFGSTPWITLAGAIIGFGGAGYLVHLQLKRSETLDTPVTNKELKR